MSFKNLWKRYKNNEDGNFSVFFAAGFLSTFMLMATALDLMIIHKTKSKLQLLADSSALHVVKNFSSAEDKEAFFEEYVNLLSEYSNGDEISIEDVQIVETDNLITLRATVSAPLRLTLLQNAFQYTKVSVDTEAEAGIENIEIALVLDISSSMNGARITEAKEAATAFVENILGNEDLRERVTVSLVPFGGTVRVPDELVGLLNLPEEGPVADAFSQHWVDRKWNQCFRYTTDEVEDGIQRDRQYDPIEDFHSFGAENNWCPIAGNEFVALTNDPDKLIETIDDLTLSDGTGTDQGMLWGVETLDHDWIDNMPGGMENTPGAHDDEGTRKFIILMSDGGITSQHFPREQDIENSGMPPYDAKGGASKVLPNYRTGDARRAYESKCDEAKDDLNIEIYSIGFLLRADKPVHKEDLEYCATSKSHYFDARSGELERIFLGLANSISPVRLSN